LKKHNFKGMIMATIEQIKKDSSRIYTNEDPITIQAAITDYCMNKCFMCDHWKRKDKTYIDADRWIWFLKSLRNTKTVFYTGGDSIIHRDINRIMANHLELDIDFGFISTGFIPDDVDMHLLSRAKFFNVSLDTTDYKLYEKLRGGIDLELVFESIEKARKYNVNVGVTAVISKENVDEVGDLITFSVANRMNLRLNFLHDLYSVDDISIKEDLTKARILFENINKKLEVKYEKYPFSKCYVPYYNMFVDAKGDVYPCCIQAGDTEEQPNIQPLGTIEDFTMAKSLRGFFIESGVNDKCVNCIPSFTKINNINNNFEKKFVDVVFESRNFY